MKSKLIIIMLLVLALIGIVSCDSRDPKPLPPDPIYNIASISANPDTIYADNDRNTTTSVSVLVVDNNNIAVPDWTVSFKADRGAIDKEAVTGTNGVATATFDDNGASAGVATITALINGRQASTTVTIRETPLAHIKNMIAIPDSLTADLDDATFSSVKVIVEDENDVPAQSVTVTFYTTDEGNRLATFPSTVTSDINGVAMATVNDLGRAGTLKLYARVGASLDSVNVRFKADPSMTYMVDRVIANPNRIYADNDVATTSQVMAFIKNQNGFPVPNYTVNFRVQETNLGYITASVLTDLQGVATATFNDLGVQGTATVIASIADPNAKKGRNAVLTGSTQITIAASPTYSIGWMRATPEVIYQDNNLTYATIKAYVKDQDNFPVTSKSVRFRAMRLESNGSLNGTIGGIITNTVSDSSGVATTTFWDQNDLGTARIQAFIGDHATPDAFVDVEIQTTPAITDFDLIVNTQDISIDEVIQIRATAKNSLNQFVPDGTVIAFSTTNGEFVDATGNLAGQQIMASTVNGSARVDFNAGKQTGTAEIRAFIGEQIAGPQVVTINPGNPKYITFLEHAAIVEAGGSETTISAAIEDMYRNPVKSGVSVQWKTTLGTILPLSNTNSNGIASTIFSPGLTSGVATIKAKNETLPDSTIAYTSITVNSDDVQSIRFAVADKVDMQVQGTGGVESYELAVNLYDLSGNLVTNADSLVYFEFVQAPNGTSLNNQVIFPQTTPVGVRPANGRAAIAVNSGAESGTITIRAYTHTSIGNIVSAQKSNIVINSGPAANADIRIEDNGNGSNLGAGNWSIILSAAISDSYGNPVSDGTAVFFSINPTFGQTQPPSWASIVGSSFVGNEIEGGEGTNGAAAAPGMAYTLLQYSAIHTNESITIRVESGSLIKTSTIVLPMQSPTIYVTPENQHVMWGILNTGAELAQSHGQAATVRASNLRIVVRDGQNIPINGVSLSFSSNPGGYFLDSGSDSDSNIYTEKTATISGEMGRINKIFCVQQGEIEPPPAPGVASTKEFTITMRILGITQGQGGGQSSETITINGVRYE